MDQAHDNEPLSPPNQNTFGNRRDVHEFNVATIAAQNSPTPVVQTENDSEPGFVLGYN